MQQKLSLALLLAFSLIGCAGPKVTVCVLDPVNQNLQCFDSKTGKSSVLLLKDAENYVCLSPSDEQAVLNYCKNK